MNWLNYGGKMSSGQLRFTVGGADTWLGHQEMTARRHAPLGAFLALAAVTEYRRLVA